MNFSANNGRQKGANPKRDFLLSSVAGRQGWPDVRTVRSDSSAAAPFRSRTFSLRMIGALLIALGGLSLFSIPALIEAQPTGGWMTVASRIVPLATLMIFCGWGLWHLRRWARVAVLAGSFVAVAKGVLATLQFSEQFPLLMREPIRGEQLITPEMIDRMIAIAPFLGAGLYLFLPAMCLWVVSSRDARLTCEARGPEPSWIEEPPEQILPLAMLFAWEGAMLLSMTTYGGAIPFFGNVITGPLGMAILTLIGWLCLRCALGLFRCEPAAWHLALFLLLTGLVSTHLSEQAELSDQLHAAMGFSEAQMQMMNRIGESPWPFPWLASGMIAALAYTFFVRRYFAEAREGTA